MNGKTLKRLKRMLLRVIRKSLGSFGRRLLGSNLNLPRTLVRTAALSIALYGGVTLALPGRALAGDWTYDPKTPIPQGGYYDIVDFDGGDTLEMLVGNTVSLGAPAPFAIYDVDGNLVSRDVIAHVRISAASTSSGSLNISNNSAPDSWTIQDNGTFFSKLGTNSAALTFASTMGDATFTVGATAAGNAVTTVMNIFQIGGTSSTTVDDGIGRDGFLTINNGGNRFYRNVRIGGDGASGVDVVGGDGTLEIKGGINSFSSIANTDTTIGGAGRGDDQYGQGGEGELTIADGVNLFGRTYVGGSGGAAAHASGNDGGYGGIGNVTIDGGLNYFADSLVVGGSGGRGDPEYGSYADGGKGGDGNLTITGGKTVFATGVTVGGTGGSASGGGAAGARGVGTMTVSGGDVFFKRITVTVGGAAGSFELGADATLHTAGTLTISAANITLSGTLALDLSESGSALQLTNMTNFTSGTDIDFLAFSGDASKNIMTMSSAFNFDSYVAAQALTVLGTPIAQTRAAGASITQMTAAPFQFLSLNGGPEVGSIYWDATVDGNWDVTTANWDTSGVAGKETDGRFLPGDTVYFGTPGYAQGGTVTIVPDRVTVDEMTVAGGDWVFRGGDIVGGIVLVGGVSTEFDTRTHQSSFAAIGVNEITGEYRTDIEAKVDAIQGETLTISTANYGVMVSGAQLTLGSAGGTVVFANNSLGVYGMADYPGYAMYTGALKLAGGATRFVNNTEGATGTLNLVVIADGENSFVNNGNTVSGVGALRAVQSDIWDAGPVGDSGNVRISGGTNVFIGNAAGTVSGTALDGGAIYAEKGVYITGGVNSFTNNVAAGKGGAIYAAGNARIIAADGDMIFRGNIDSGGANAIFFAGDWDSSVVIGAGAGNTIYFYDPIELESGTAFPATSISVGSATETGTVRFDSHTSTVRNSFYINGGTVQMTGGAAFDDTDVTNALFSVGGSATLFADTKGNSVAFNRIAFDSGSLLQMDMTGAVDKDDADATTNLILSSYSSGTIETSSDPFRVEAINVTGLDGAFLLIDTGTTFNFAGKYVGTISGGSSSGARSGIMSFDDSQTGKLYLTTGGADIARTAAWIGEAGDGVWNGTSDNWLLDDPDPVNNPLDPAWKIFKNSDWVEFNASATLDNAIEVAAGGSSTAVLVQGMTVSGANNWTFTGDDIIGSPVAPNTDADFVMDGSGVVEFQNKASFSNYAVNNGTLKVGAGFEFAGNLGLAASAKVSMGYGTTVDGALTLASGSGVSVDMTGATQTDAGLTADTVAITGALDITVTNFAGIAAGNYTVIEDLSGLFDFSSVTLNGSINGGASLPLTGVPSDRYGTVDFDTSTIGQLDIVTTGADIARLATWDGGSGTWNEAIAGWTLDGGSASRYFKDGDSVAFGGAGAGDNAVVVDGYDSATSVGVGGMTVAGGQNWTFSGDDISGSGDFAMNGSGSVLFQNDTSFANYNINSGTLETSASAELDGDVKLAAAASLKADYGTEIVGGLSLADGSSVKADIAGATASGAALTVDSVTMTAGDSFNLVLTGVGAVNGSYAVIVDAGGSFDFSNAFAGTINGQSAPIVTPPNERYGKTGFDTATAGTLAVVVAGADIARTATYTGADGAWSETATNWSLDGGSTSNHFKNGDSVIFNTAGGDQVTVTPTSPSSTTLVSSMTVEGGGAWTFTGGSLLGQALTGDQAFGDGRLVIAGAGTAATFENAIDFKGGIVISLGSNTLTLDYSGATPLVNDNAISGDGSLIKDGDGELELSGSNTYSGGSEIVAGTLTAKSAGALGSGDVTTSNAGLLKLDFAGEFANGILGTGNVEAAGSGVVINDTTNVAMTVTGTLKGDATYYSLVVRNGATIAPGSSPGTITVDNGAKFESGSTYEYEINVNDITDHDLLVVTAGDVVIESGARLDVVFLDGDTRVTSAAEVVDAGVQTDDRFRVIAAAESQFTGLTQFDIVNTWSTRFTQGLESDGYYIYWAYVAPEFANSVTGFATPNALRAARAMDAIQELGIEGGIKALYDALANMPDDPAALAAAFGQLHGEAYASAREASLLLGRRFVRTLPGIMERTDEYETQTRGRGFASLADCGVDPFRIWASVDGDWFRRKNTSSHSGYRVNTYGVALGGDYLFGDNAFGGFAFGYDDATVKFKRLSAKDEIDAFHFALYGGLRFGDWHLNGHVGYTNNRHEMRRSIGFASTGGDYRQSARGKYNDDMFSTGFEVGRRLWLGLAELTPSLGLDYMRLDSPSVTERKAGDANLHVRGGADDSLQLRLGAKLNRDFKVDNVKWTPEVRAYYTAELADESASVRSSFAALRGVGFRSASADRGRHGGQFGAGLKADVNGKFDMRMDYDFELRKNASAHTLSLSAGLNF